MRRSSLFLVGALLVVSLTVAGNVAAQQGEAIETFTCESKDNRHNECRYSSSGMVTVHVNRQLSSTRCVFDENWGTFDGGVWVDYGCRAEFVVRRPPGYTGQSDYYGYGSRPVGGTMQTVTCESQNNAYKVCTVRGFDFSSVHLERKLSSAPCTRGVSWGVSSGENAPPGIWVDKGCRATFAYTTEGGSYQPYGGTPHDFNLDCISEMSEWRHCEVPQIYLARVELVSGNNQCNAYKAWGTDDTGIWVRNNCMGTFRVRYRH